jgi:hypothetical protein
VKAVKYKDDKKVQTRITPHIRVSRAKEKVVTHASSVLA